MVFKKLFKWETLNPNKLRKDPFFTKNIFKISMAVSYERKKGEKFDDFVRGLESVKSQILQTCVLALQQNAEEYSLQRNMTVINIPEYQPKTKEYSLVLRFIKRRKQERRIDVAWDAQGRAFVPDKTQKDNEDLKTVRVSDEHLLIDKSGNPYILVDEKGRSFKQASFGDTYMHRYKDPSERRPYGYSPVDLLIDGEKIRIIEFGFVQAIGLEPVNPKWGFVFDEKGRPLFRQTDDIMTIEVLLDDLITLNEKNSRLFKELLGTDFERIVEFLQEHKGDGAHMKKYWAKEEKILKKKQVLGTFP